MNLHSIYSRNQAKEIGFQGLTAEVQEARYFLESF